MKPWQLTLGLTLFTSGALACEYPPLAELPAAEVTAEQEVSAIEDDMLRYIVEMREYVECIQGEYAAGDAAGATRMHLSLLAMRNNAAVAELENVRKVYEARVGSVDDMLAKNGVVTEEGAHACVPAGPGFSYQIANEQRVVLNTREGYFLMNLDACPRVTRSTNLNFGNATEELGTNICIGSAVLINNIPCNITSPFREITQAEADEIRGR